MKKANPEKSIGMLMNEPATGLQYVIAKAKQLNQLNKMLYSFLANSNLQDHCQVVNWRANNLVLAADSASWCTLLRYECPKLLSLYREAGVSNLQSIICQVQTPAEHNEKKIDGNKTPLLSKENAKYMLEMAEEISHPRLRSVLEKLAKL